MEPLVEYQRSVGRVTPAQAAVLRGVFGATIEPTDTASEFAVTPGSIVGVARTEDGDVVVAPRFGIHRALHLLTGSLDLIRPLPDLSGLPAASGLVSATAALFCRVAEQALAQGSAVDYHEVRDVRPVLRGRVEMAAQVSRSYGRTAPLHVRYDEFDDDVLPNQLLLAAAHQLRTWTTRDQERFALTRITSALEAVSLLPFDPQAIPEVRYRRQDAHLQPAVELARLILAGSTPEVTRQRAAAQVPCLTFDMADAFECYVRNRLRRALALTTTQWPSGGRLATRLTLFDEGILGLEPDLSWWEGSQCVFIGDVKYKAADRRGLTSRDDVTQVLAYAITTGLDQALIIAASGPTPAANAGLPMTVRRIGTRIRTVWIDLTTPDPATLDNQVDALAGLVRAMRSRP